MKGIIALAFLVAFTAEASALTCADVRWYVAHMTKEQIAAYVASATKEQIAFGRRCLQKRHLRHHR